jgi:hypothetical protein
MTKSRLIFAGIFAAIFAIPMVTLVSMMVVFPIIFYAVIAAIANFGPLVLLPMYALQRLGYRVDPTQAFEGWVYCSIIWVGCAFGFAHWGDVGASIGAATCPTSTYCSRLTGCCLVCSWADRPPPRQRGGRIFGALGPHSALSR